MTLFYWPHFKLGDYVSVEPSGGFLGMFKGDAKTGTVKKVVIAANGKCMVTVAVLPFETQVGWTFGEHNTMFAS